MKPRLVYPADGPTKHGKGRGKVKPHRVVAALSFKPSEPSACLFHTDWGVKSTVIFVYWNKCVPYSTGSHYTQVQEKTGNPEQIPDAWLKPGLKIDKRLEDNFIRTQFTGGGGGICFSFQSNTGRKSQRIHLLLPQCPFHPNEGQRNASHSHTHMDSVQKPSEISLRVIPAALTTRFGCVFPLPKEEQFIHKQGC